MRGYIPVVVDIPQVYDMANAALATNPLNTRNKEFVQELKKKIAEQS
ncbi:MAG: hypothetical protein ACRD4R_11755 [Candidatus Acidiferrales bacterium]